MLGCAQNGLSCFAPFHFLTPFPGSFLPYWGVYLFFFTSATKLHFSLGVFLHFITGADTDFYPTLHPVFQVVPFQHLYQLLDEEVVDVTIAFQEKSTKKMEGIYKKLTQVRIAGILPVSHPLADREMLDEDDLRSQRLLLLAPQRCPDSLNAIQQKLATGRSVSDLLMCGSADACVALAKAGFGITVQPEFLSLWDIASTYIPIEGTELLSYGAYYKTVAGKPLLKLFLQICKEAFSSIE